MQNAIIILILAALAVGITVFLVRAKKNGQTCIGCPNGGKCGGGCCGCGGTHGKGH